MHTTQSPTDTFISHKQTFTSSHNTNTHWCWVILMSHYYSIFTLERTFCTSCLVMKCFLETHCINSDRLLRSPIPSRTSKYVHDAEYYYFPLTTSNINNYTINYPLRRNSLADFQCNIILTLLGSGKPVADLVLIHGHCVLSNTWPQHDHLCTHWDTSLISNGDQFFGWAFEQVSSLLIIS